MAWDTKTRTWQPSGVWQFDAKGALKALDQMATLLGMKRPEDPGKSAGQTLEQYMRERGGNQREF